MAFVPVSVTSMAGIPASRAGVASGFLMTGHEIGAAVSVAALSAIASTAGALTDPTAATHAFDRKFVGAAVLAALIAIVAYVRMSSVRATGGGGHPHMHANTDPVSASTSMLVRAARIPRYSLRAFIA
jgi:hypothetical protein